MNFIYNTSINESKNLIDFFDWRQDDSIKRIKKIPIIKIRKNDWLKIYTNEVKINNLIGEYIITDGFNAIYIKSLTNFKIKRSMLPVSDELEAIEISYKLNTSCVKYEIIEPIKYELKLRQDIENEHFIEENITKLFNRNNQEEIRFFLLDCNITVKDSNITNIIEIIKSNPNIYNHALNFFKLINYSHNS